MKGLIFFSLSSREAFSWAKEILKMGNKKALNHHPFRGGALQA
jgi:hypothetical protein